MNLGIRLCFLAVCFLTFQPNSAIAAKAERDGPALSVARLFRSPIKPEDELLVDLNSPNAGKVVTALGQLEKKYSSSTNAHAAIRTLLRDSRSQVRRRAARTLGNCRAAVSEEDIQSICRFFQASDLGEIVDGLKALRTLAAPKATPSILPLLQHHDHGVVRDACRTLAEIGTAEAIPAIQPLTTHQNDDVREDAQRAATKLRLRAASSSGFTREESRRTTIGTGFVAADGGYILTCAHVVGTSTSITVRATSGALHTATVVASDHANDLCLILAPTITNTVIPTVEANSVAVGQAVYCLGYPMEGGVANNVSPVVGNGVVASLRGLEGDPRHLQVTVAMNPGNSGGPIFDESGRWLGVATHKLADLYSLRKTGQLPQGFNFAVKSALATPLFDTVANAKLRVAPKTEKIPLEQLVNRLSQSVVCVFAN